MRFITQQSLRRMLKERYPNVVQGYFWDTLEHLSEFDLHGRLSWRRIASTSISAVQLVRAQPPFVLFTDRIAGWLQAPKRRRWSPVRFDSLDEALTFICTRSHFCDGTAYEDNYYLCDGTLEWFIAFCHHDGWHLWLPRSIASRPSWREWQTKMDVKRFEPLKTTANLFNG